MCAMSTVLKPREMPKAMKASMREIPVTMSEFSMGMLLTPMTMERGSFFMLFMPMAAAVPMTVAASAESRAIRSVLCRAFMMAVSCSMSAYQCSVKPPHSVRDFVSLKESTIMVTMGAYRNK